MASIPVQRRNSLAWGTNPGGTEPRSHVVELSVSLCSSLKHLLKKPYAFPFLLFLFLLLTWVSLKLQHSSYYSSSSSSSSSSSGKWENEDFNGYQEATNLVALRSGSITKDKRGWLLNPVSLANDYGIRGGAVSCASVHVGEIRPGGVRGNHRHHGCNETFLIWGAQILFRLENNEIVGKGYAEVIVGADEVALAASPNGTAHALKNVDALRTAYFIGCQDSVINYNSSTTDFNVWQNL